MLCYQERPRILIGLVGRLQVVVCLSLEGFVV